jgi:hypothetical protein
MADEKEDSPSAGVSMPRVRRRAPTIELKATEVAVEPPAASDGQPQAHPEPESAAPPEYSTQPPEYDRGGATAELPHSEPPPAESSNATWHQFLGRPAVEASLAGGLAALIVFIVLWLGGMFSRPEGTLSPRVAVLETRLRELASRPPAAPDTRPTDELSARVNRLERATASNADAGNAASDETIKSLQAGAADLARRVNDNATAIREARGQADAALKAADAARAAGERNDVEALNNRLAALERASKTLAEDVAKSIAAAGDRPLRAAVAAQALQAAVERGAPFAAELTATKAVLGNSQAVAALEPFAASGLPPTDKLARELADITLAMLKARPAPPPSGGFLDRLQANAEKLVRVRRIDEAPGDDPGAVFGRAQAKAARGDLAGAAAELKALPADVRAPADEWIKKVEARRGALEASHRVVADALGALGKISP